MLDKWIGCGEGVVNKSSLRLLTELMHGLGLPTFMYLARTLRSNHFSD